MDSQVTGSHERGTGVRGMWAHLKMRWQTLGLPDLVHHGMFSPELIERHHARVGDMVDEMPMMVSSDR
jgi:hypothetical protein